MFKTQKAEDIKKFPETDCVNSDLWGSEAECRQFGVGFLWVNHHQAFFLVQTQVPTCGDVANAERLTPLHVAPTPAADKPGTKTLHLIVSLQEEPQENHFFKDIYSPFNSQLPSLTPSSSLGGNFV